MQSLSPLYKNVLGKSRKQLLHLNASRSEPSSQPPVATPLDHVLKKAAGKVRLAHPVQEESQKSQQQSTKRPTARSAASRSRTTQPESKQPRPQSPVVDDDALFADITEIERDSVWEALRMEVETGSSTDDRHWLPDNGNSGWPSPPPQRRTAARSARDDHPLPNSSPPSFAQPVASTSGFKGFGKPPRQPSSTSSAAANSYAPSKAPRQPSAAHSSTVQNPPNRPSRKPDASASPSAAAVQQHRLPPGGARPASSSPPSPAVIRIFLFNAEAALTRDLLQRLGLTDRVKVVEDLRSADVVVAAKLARSGKHVNLTQGERTAANLGIPFVVVGRHMSADNLQTALAPLLDPRVAGQQAAAGAGGSRRGPTAAELQAHRLEVMYGFAQMLRTGTVGAAEHEAPTGAGTGV